MYNKGSGRNEASLLKLYDGKDWKHETVNSTNFNMPYTKLVVGGFIQTPIMLSMLESREQNQSGFLPRFTTFLFKPCQTDMSSTSKIHSAIKQKFVSTIQSIDLSHLDALSSPKIKHVVERGTSAFHLFCSFADPLNRWIVENYFVSRLDRARGIVSKAIGQVLRLSSIYNALFLFFDINAVVDLENQSEYPYTKAICYDITSDVLPVSLMAMEAAIQTISFSVQQNFILQGIDFLSLSIVKDVVTVFDSQVSIEPSPVVNCEESTTSTIVRNANPATTLISTSSGPSKRMSFQTDLGKLLLLPGTVFNMKKINDLKVLGRTAGRRMAFVINNYTELMNLGFGEIKGEEFRFFPNIVEMMKENEQLINSIIGAGVQIPKFVEARAVANKYHLAPQKAKRSKSGKENIPTPHSHSIPSASYTPHSPLIPSNSPKRVQFMGLQNALLSPAILTSLTSCQSSAGSQYLDTDDDDFQL